MIEEQAQVVEINDNELLLRAQTQSTCGSCQASKGCGTSLLSKVVGRKFTEFHAENTIGATVGDTVVVAIAEDALLKGSMVMYLVPLLGMFGLAMLGDQMFVADLQSRDLMVALSAIIGFIAGAAAAKYYFSSLKSSHSYTPVVLRKIISHGKL